MIMNFGAHGRPRRILPHDRSSFKKVSLTILQVPYWIPLLPAGLSWSWSPPQLPISAPTTSLNPPPLTSSASQEKSGSASIRVNVRTIAADNALMHARNARSTFWLQHITRRKRKTSKKIVVNVNADRDHGRLWWLEWSEWLSGTRVLEYLTYPLPLGEWQLLGKHKDRRERGVLAYACHGQSSYIWRMIFRLGLFMNSMPLCTLLTRTPFYILTNICNSKLISLSITGRNVRRSKLRFTPEPWHRFVVEKVKGELYLVSWWSTALLISPSTVLWQHLRKACDGSHPHDVLDREENSTHSNYARESVEGNPSWPPSRQPSWHSLPA